jgi:hypothetical protein
MNHYDISWTICVVRIAVFRQAISWLHSDEVGNTEWFVYGPFLSVADKGVFQRIYFKNEAHAIMFKLKFGL